MEQLLLLKVAENSIHETHKTTGPFQPFRSVLTTLFILFVTNIEWGKLKSRNKK